jgi:hypothetical protein
MNKRTINGMHKSELVTLIKGTVVKVDKIDQALEKTDLIDEFYEQIKVVFKSFFVKVLKTT